MMKWSTFGNIRFGLSLLILTSSALSARCNLSWDCGLRRDTLKWSIGNDFVTSELKFNNATSLYNQLGLRCEWKIPLVLKMELGVGEFFDGEVRDTDHLGPAVVRSRGDLSGGVGRLDLGLGWRWNSFLSTFLGIAADTQVWDVTDLYLWTSMSDKKSMYAAVWATWWVGGEFQLLQRDSLTLTGHVIGASGTFYRDAVWGLRLGGLGALYPRAHILKGGANLAWQISRRWNLRASTEANYGWTTGGEVILEDVGSFENCRWWSAQTLVGVLLKF
jgi:hypothetical protein